MNIHGLDAAMQSKAELAARIAETRAEIARERARERSISDFWEAEAERNRAGWVEDNIYAADAWFDRWCGHTGLRVQHYRADERFVYCGEPECTSIVGRDRPTMPGIVRWHAHRRTR